MSTCDGVVRAVCTGCLWGSNSRFTEAMMLTWQVHHCFDNLGPSVHWKPSGRPAPPLAACDRLPSHATLHSTGNCISTRFAWWKLGMPAVVFMGCSRTGVTMGHRYCRTHSMALVGAGASCDSAQPLQLAPRRRVASWIDHIGVQRNYGDV